MWDGRLWKAAVPDEYIPPAILGKAIFFTKRETERIEKS
jgi:hypothetical protein